MHNQSETDYNAQQRHADKLRGLDQGSDLPTEDLSQTEATPRRNNQPQSKSQQDMSALEEFMMYLRVELRTGGGATLDELYNLAQAIQEDFEELSHRLNQTGAKDE